VDRERLQQAEVHPVIEWRQQFAALLQVVAEGGAMSFSRAWASHLSLG
jgi:hypothetical protein